MNFKIKAGEAEARLLLKALAAWALSALGLLLLSAFVLSRLNTGEAVMGYISSALSFLTALCTGLVIGLRRRDGVVYFAMLTAAILVTALLTIGFMVDGAELDGAGVLSVVSFTFAGCLLGAVLPGGKKPKKRRMNLKR